MALVTSNWSIQKASSCTSWLGISSAAARTSMPPMRNVPSGMKTRGIPSTVDTRSFVNSVVAKISIVGVNVGTTLSIVEVEITRGGIVGSGVKVDATFGVPVQAVRINKRAGMIFFIINYVIARRTQPDDTCAARSAGEQSHSWNQMMSLTQSPHST